MTNNFSPALEQFVNRLLAEKKLSDLEPGVRDQAKADLLEKAEERVKAAIFANMPADKLAEFTGLMDSGDEAKLQTFIQEAIPNLEQIIAQSLLDFRDTYLG